jgi:nitrogen fixation NifU-like protein
MMYSQKVMEHFRNPRNVGEIKDADGIGKVGNPVCVPPDTSIIVRNSIHQIGNLKNSDMVLSHDGDFHKIDRIFNRRYTGTILKIKTRLGTTTLTPDHMVFGFEVPKRNKYRYTKGKKELIKNLAWLHAYELNKGDIVAYPIPNKILDVKEIETNVEKSKHDFKSFEIPPRISVDGDFMRFAGYFLAEGRTRMERSKTYAELTFNINEEDKVVDVCQLVRKIFGIEPKIERIQKKKAIKVLIYSVHVARFLRKLFGKVNEKHIPEFMMYLPLEKQAELIKGLWYGGGYLDLKRPRASYSTISEELAHQIKILLLRQGIIPSVYEEQERASEGTRHRKAYRIFVLHTPSLMKLSSILSVDLNLRKKSRSEAWIEDNVLFTPITSVEKINYSGLVYNLEVKDAHSYLTPSLALHNCGDLMWIYIKVKDNRIEDIKFKTFGCGAAIATSSMITELAKGKTIEEALKITRQDVADALGGLPPIKMHCSNLAADGLKAAILDYMKKKGIKPPEGIKIESETDADHCNV